MATKTQSQGQKAKNVAEAVDNEVVIIEWVETQYAKFAGKEQIAEYMDRETGEEVILIHPGTKLPTPFTIMENRATKLLLTTNPWHKAVYDFIMGKTEPGGTWRGYPSFNPSKKKFTIENITEKAKRNNLNRKQIRSLQTKVEAMSNEALMQFGLLFGFDPKKESYDDILDGIEKIIETPASDNESFFTAANVKETLEDPDFNYIVLVAVLKQNGTIKLDNGTYKYNGATVAVSDEQLIQWLKDNSTVYVSLKDKYLVQDTIEQPAEV